MTYEVTWVGLNRIFEMASENCKNGEVTKGQQNTLNFLFQQCDKEHKDFLLSKFPLLTFLHE